MTVQKWRIRGDEIYINLSREWTANESLPRISGRYEDFFMVKVLIDNDSVYKKYDALVTAKRRDKESQR
jgi:hypothetical protein